MILPDLDEIIDRNQKRPGSLDHKLPDVNSWNILTIRGNLWTPVFKQAHQSTRSSVWILRVRMTTNGAFVPDVMEIQEIAGQLCQEFGGTDVDHGQITGHAWDFLIEVSDEAFRARFQ